MKNSHTTKILGVAILLALSASGALVFTSLFLNEQAVRATDRMQTIADEQAVLKEQAQLASIISETAANREALSSYVLQGDDGTVALLSKIDNIADTLLLELTTNTLTVNDVKDSRFDQLELTFSLAGPEPDMRQMIKFFETIPYANEITQMDMTRTTDRTTGRPIMKGNISLLISIVEL